MMPLTFVLRPGAGEVRGMVLTDTGAAASEADVVLIPQFSRRANVLFYDRTRVDDRGLFVFKGIAPGEYKVFAFEQLPYTAERNAAFIARYETLGHAVTVSVASTTEIRIHQLGRS